MLCIEQDPSDLTLMERLLGNRPDVKEVVRRLRGAPTTRKIPVVVTSDCTEGQMRRLFAAGANEYLTKPLDVHRFLETTGEALGAASRLEV